MTQNLNEKKCIPCESGGQPLSEDQIVQYMKQLADWRVVDDNRSIIKKITFDNFKQAWQFIDKVSALAELEGHHPDLSFGWGYVEIRLTTHAVKGISENDFIMASKIDLLN